MSPPKIKVLEVTFNRCPPQIAATTTYKLKLRVVLRNDDSRIVTLGKPAWRADSQQVQLQPPLGYSYQVETAPGSWKQGTWQNERKDIEIAVRPGEAFRLWLGISPNYQENDLQQMHESKQLGILIIPATIPAFFRKRREVKIPL